MKKYKLAYLIWLFLLVIGAVPFKGHKDVTTIYFVANILFLATVNLLSIRDILKVAQKYDAAHYEQIRSALVTKTNAPRLHSDVPEVQAKIVAYKGFLPYSIANVIVIILLELFLML